MRWEDIRAGDWFYSSNSGRLGRVIEIFPTRDFVTVVPLLDISKKFQLTKTVFHAKAIKKCVLMTDFTKLTPENYFQCEGGTRIECPVWLKHLEVRDQLPTELRIPELSYPKMKSEWIITKKGYTQISELEKTEVTAKKLCTHSWKPTHLWFSTVYDCSICGAKKEDT